MKLPAPLWVELYIVLSSYIEDKLYPLDDDKNEDAFIEIVDDVEHILRKCGLEKGE